MRLFFTNVFLVFFSFSVISQVIWQDDFSNQNNWLISNTSAQGGAVLGWSFNSISNLGTPGQPFVPSQAFVPNANGNYILASYFQSGGSIVGDDIRITTVNNINLSGHPNVILEWDNVVGYHTQDPQQLPIYSYPMSFQVRLSTNGGITWSIINLTNSMYGSNPGHQMINISQYCGNQTNVKIQFRIIGYNPNNGSGDNFDWGIDNVKIRKLLTNDLNISGSEYQTLTTLGNIPRAYTSIPVSQVKPFKSTSKVTNYGSSLQNASIGCSFNSAIYTSGISTLNTLNSNILSTSGTISTPLTQGNYSMTTTVNSSVNDGYLQDNTISKSFQISESIYGRDSQFLFSWYDAHLGWSSGESGYGQIFEINSNTYVRNIQVYIPNDPSILNNVIFSALYSFDPINNQIIRIGQSSDFTINSTHLGNYINVPLESQVLMNTGQQYIAALLVYQVSNLKRVFAFSESTLSANSVAVQRVNNVDFIPIIAGSSGNSILNWNPMIRMQICQPSYNQLSISACESYILPSGQVISSSGTYFDSLINVLGCDSIVTYNIEIFQPQVSNISLTTCDFPYDWNGQVCPTPGNYAQVLQNIHGCDSNVNLVLSNLNIQANQDICIVGNDAVTSKNKIVWEKEITQAIDSYRIFRENSLTGSFELIGSTLYSDSSWFIDQTSNPIQQAYRYNIKYVDSCGNESIVGSTHKTIHLTINQGVGNNWNLIWTPYEGTSYSSYSIYRGSTPSNMSLLTTVPSNLTTYTDGASPAGFVYYQIEIEIPNTCSPTKNLYDNSRSNISTNDPNSNGIMEDNSAFIHIFPNPVSELFHIQFDGEISRVEILDMQGKIVHITLGNQKSIRLPKNLDSGFYMVSIQTQLGLFKKAIVISK